MRAGPGLGMELDGASAQLGIGEPLDGAVVQRLVRGGTIGARRDREPVVLGGDEDSAARTLDDRVIRASVPEGSL